MKAVLIGDCSFDKASNLVPIITETAIGKREKVTVFGNDYNTPDGTCIRDYIHVVDLANAHVHSLNYLTKHCGKHIYNIGTGKGLSVLEIIQAFEQSTKQKLNVSISPRREGDIEQIYSDITRSNKQLGWKAKLSLSDAMKSAWHWNNKTRRKNRLTQNKCLFVTPLMSGFIKNDINIISKNTTSV